MKIIYPSHIGLADAQYRYFEMTEHDMLIIFLTSWDEREIVIEFTNVLRFTYHIGSIISELYEITESLYLTEAIGRYYVKMPDSSEFRHFQIEDVDGFPFIEVVSQQIQVIKTNKIIRFKNLK